MHERKHDLDTFGGCISDVYLAREFFPHIVGQHSMKHFASTSQCVLGSVNFGAVIGKNKSVAIVCIVEVRLHESTEIFLFLDDHLRHLQTVTQFERRVKRDTPLQETHVRVAFENTQNLTRSRRARADGRGEGWFLLDFSSLLDF